MRVWEKSPLAQPLSCGHAEGIASRHTLPSEFPVTSFERAATVMWKRASNGCDHVIGPLGEHCSAPQPQPYSQPWDLGATMSLLESTVTQTRRSSHSIP